MSDLTISPVTMSQPPSLGLCPAMGNLSASRHIFCNMYVVVTPVVERQLDPCLGDTEEEEMDRRHKVEKVNRKSRANFTFMKQHF
ncbi:hypothetical protein [Kistimonas asteriae]|uniref:hypothetical protein n=1 Tax=Kistimonas asteriae TaxID=517724 RepID=UPI001BAAC778|nr:hypothetical protein [Kistimonas asteriae]